MSPERLGEIFDSHHEGLYRLARRLAGDPEEARDLVQETFLRAARRPSLLPADSTGCEAWLVRTLVNLCRDRNRRLRVRAHHARGLLPRAIDVHSLPAAAARVMVQSALARLAPRRRAIVVLHELEGIEVQEIAGRLGLSRVTVRWHLAMARRDLRKMLIGPVSDRKG